MKYAKKTDGIIIAILVVTVLSGLFLFSDAYGQTGTFAEIYYRSELVKTVELNTGMEEKFSIEQEPNVIFHLHGDGSISFAQSDCPDKICIQSGKLHLAGHHAACLPNLLYVKISAGDGASGGADLYL